MGDVQVRRFIAELRAMDVSGTAIEGHAAVFDTFAEIGSTLEQLASTAFDRALADGDDVRALKNHDPNLVLGRVGKNLELSVDDIGLHFRIDPLPDTQAARDLREEMAAGLITGASFGFIPGEEEFDIAGDGRAIVTHTSIAQLLDVSPVTFPAYTTTDATLRAIVISSTGSKRARLVRARQRTRKRA